jgi:hypothetical protein
MAKMGCAKCGGTKKMKAGGSAKVNISKRGAGFAKSQTGGSNIGSMIFGIPNSGMTGPNRNSVTETMKKGGVAKKVTTKLVKAKSGMSLKKVPSGKVGLAKLPTAVRNKMGYMKKGGPGKSLKRYQGNIGSSEVGPSMDTPTPTSTSTPTSTPAPLTDNDLINKLIDMGKSPKEIKQIMKAKTKVAINPNNVITGAANVGSSLINAFANKGNNSGGMTESPGFNRKGGASKFVSKKPAMKKGGVTRKVMVKSKKK